MTPPAQLGIGLAFTACAGFIDAVGLLQLGGYFVSFMSGNTTQLGAGIGAGQLAGMVLPFLLVLMFFGGSFAGTMIASSAGSRGPAAVLGLVLLLVLASIGMVAGGVAVHPALLTLAAAGGAQNAVLPPRGAARLGATFVTGTLFAAGQDLARAVRNEAPRWRWLQHLLVWASLCLGASLGAAANAAFGVPALLLPAAVYAVFLLGFLIGPRHSTSVLD